MNPTITSAQVLEWMETHADCFNAIQAYMCDCEDITCKTVLDEISRNIEGMECILPLVMAASSDQIVFNVYAKLFFRMFRKWIEEDGADKALGTVRDMLLAERDNVENMVSHMQK